MLPCWGKRQSGACNWSYGRIASGFRTEEVVVPDADRRQQHRRVFLRRSGGEVLIHRMRAGQQLNESCRAHGENDGQTNRRPQGVTAANPVPEFEHVGRCRCRTRQPAFARWWKARRSVSPRACRRPRLPPEPVARAVGVGQWFPG